MSILIVDDDKFGASLFLKGLEKREIDAYWVESGEECLELVNAGNIELVLLDVMMPEMNGDEVLRKIREKYSAVELPVIMVTSKSETDNIVEYFELGANDYIEKPVKVDMAIARIQIQLNLRQLHFDSVAKKEMEALNSMIVTYNHEINNPLTIATFAVEKCIKKGADDETLLKARTALKRIQDIVKKIENVTKDKIGTENYSNGQVMIKLS